MKKTIALILLISMSLSLFSCSNNSSGSVSGSSNSNNDDGKIELTLDNYEDYLNISTSYQASGKSISPELYTDKIGYPMINIETLVDGVTANYNYKNVEVGIKLTLSYPYYSLIDTNKSYSTLMECFYSPYDNIVEYNIKLNIAGEGTYSKILDELHNGETPNIYLQGIYVFQDEIQATCEVTSITGYLEPVR